MKKIEPSRVLELGFMCLLWWPMVVGKKLSRLKGFSCLGHNGWFVVRLSSSSKRLWLM